MSQQDLYRSLPSVDELASSIQGPWPRALIVNECRRAIEAAREAIRLGASEAPDLHRAVVLALETLAAPSLRHVINATGVILHTNLGRAPLPDSPGTGWYANLEYDLSAGKRGKRDSHNSPLLERLLGRPAILVNNNAAAVWLALNEIAAGGEVIVSRGEMIEIGDGFRIPDIMARSGAAIVEVGTTNKTRIEDYAGAIGEHTRLLMRVHPSNFEIAGFSGRPALAELTALGRARGIPVYEDLGSGCLLDLRDYGVDEPTIAESLAAGVDLVSFSGDKLLGGPQAGVLAGNPDLVTRLRRNPIFRALRLDKLVIAAMETTLRHLLFERWESLPLLFMLRQSPEEIRARAGRFIDELGLEGAEIIAGESLLGGGSTPGQTLPTYLIALPGDPVRWERRLRAGDPPVIARVENDRLLLDLRTVAPAEQPQLWRVIRASV